MSNSTIRIEDHSKEYLDKVGEALERAMEAIGIHLEGEAKEELENTPRRVDTGLLRNSITYAIDGKSAAISSYTDDEGKKSGTYHGTAPKEEKGRSVAVGTNVSYAPYVHEGTSKMAPNRFLKNAVERNKEQVTQYIKKELGG